MTQTYPAFLCFECKWFDWEHGLEDPRCRAFPKGIPMSLYRGLPPHIYPYPGDNGIQFEPLPEFRDFARRLLSALKIEVPRSVRWYWEDVSAQTRRRNRKKGHE